MPQPQVRNRPRRRRYSACQRHPGESVTGFCALCLRDRLAGLDSSSGQIEAQKVVVSSGRNRSLLRRSKSVAAEKCEGLNDLDSNRRRKSCDVRARNSLSDLFVVDDNKKSRNGELKFESVNLGFSVVETKEEDDDGDDEIRVSDDAGDEIRVSNDVIMRTEVDEDDEIRVSDDAGDEIRVSDDVITRIELDDDDEFEEGDLKTMKEIIEMELDNKRRNFWNAASVFSQKLRKWRQKQKEKKQKSRCINGGTDIDGSKLGQFSQIRDNNQSQSEVEDYKLGRRSCDTEPRFSIDGHRLSVEDPRLSFDEHRASWDGYMIARTIPRLTPMLSVDNMMVAPVNRPTIIMEKQQMCSINEDGSAQLVSDCFTSNVGSSSSSSTKKLGISGDDVKSASNARVSPANDVIFQGTKLVITEKELKDWHLNSVKNSNIESVSNAPDSSGKTTNLSRWKKVCNLWDHRHKVGDKNDKSGDKKNVEDIPENRSMNVVRNNHGLVSLRNRSTRYSTSDLDSGLLRLYLTPFRNSRGGKSGKKRGSINGH